MHVRGIDRRRRSDKGEFVGRRALITSLLAAVLAAAAAPSTAVAYDEHLCGVFGTDLGPQDSCPGISPRHAWKRVTGYRNSGANGIDMCVVIRSSANNYLFSRCSFYATTILVGSNDLNDGRELTRAYNKNNNAAVGVERRYLYASTE
jgi:hypothetical protein